ncbi:DUF695 domain-containing protein [Enterovibrio norvegicus]|uniref:DUF695 domain-containing protein n=1 Tax=Enterovibrio norvegicus TaxID=188144 RepID=UPI000C82EB88|nr:DUF695 domain-containing protein [Enterovibrio norvegicus]PMN62451.1 hypothetical protein BCT27_24980 [Enterovibrio norvegicus]
MDKDAKGIIGEVTEGGYPVIYSFVNELPAEKIRKDLNWLVVISWKYDGVSNNGMPNKDLNTSMIELEDILEELYETNSFAERAYSRTGNNLKEFVFYISNRDLFLGKFNDMAKGKPRFPIEINFYDDPSWSDYENLIRDFS